MGSFLCVLFEQAVSVLSCPSHRRRGPLRRTEMGAEFCPSTRPGFVPGVLSRAGDNGAAVPVDRSLAC